MRAMGVHGIETGHCSSRAPLASYDCRGRAIPLAPEPLDRARGIGFLEACSVPRETFTRGCDGYDRIARSQSSAFRTPRSSRRAIARVDEWPPS